MSKVADKPFLEDLLDEEARKVEGWLVPMEIDGETEYVFIEMDEGEGEVKH